MHVVENSDSNEYVACVDVKEQVCTVTNPNHKNKLLPVMLFYGHRVYFQLDTGATVTILPEKNFLRSVMVKTVYAYWKILR